MADINYENELGEYVDTSVTSDQSNQLHFGFTSQIHDDTMRQYQSEVDKQINLVSKAFNSEIEEIRDPMGSLIINATSERMWFARNVAFIFGIGSIYDEEDEALMNITLSFFDNTRDCAFFMNHYIIESFENSVLIKEIERKLKIGNGNYHVFMVPIVYANADELNDAPEGQFSKKGIVKKFMRWDTITDYMKELMARYGLITDLTRTHTPYSWEIGQEGLSVKIDNRNEVECSFDIDADPTGHAIEQIEANLNAMNDFHDNYNDRTREGKVSREGEFNVKTQSRNHRKNLYQQMYEQKQCGIPVESIHDAHMGVNLKMNDRYMPQDNHNKQAEYQLYDDNESYNESTNRNQLTNDTYDTRGNIPRLMQTSTRGSKQRHPCMGGHMEHIKSGKFES